MPHKSNRKSFFNSVFTASFDLSFLQKLILSIVKILPTFEIRKLFIRMKIFNEDYQSKIKLYRLIYIILLSTFIAVLYTTRFFDNYFPDIKKDYFLIGFITVYIIINFIRIKKKYCYFYYDDDTSNLTFRFFQLVFYASKRLAFSIPKRAFYDFKIEKKFLGLRDDLILYQKKQDKIIAYPPISLSAVPKRDKQVLFGRLNTLKLNK